MKSILEMNPEILLSFINTRLRDGQTLAALCDDLDVERRLLDARLLEGGYRFDPERQSYISIQKQQ